MAHEDPAAYVQTVRADHRDFARYLRPVRRLASDESSSFDFEARAVAMLVDLRAFLGKHFEREEAGGYMQAAADRNVKLDGEVQRLAAEHKLLLAKLDEAVELARGCANQHANVEILRASLRDMLEALVAHEAAEQALLEEGFQMDPDLRSVHRCPGDAGA